MLNCCNWNSPKIDPISIVYGMAIPGSLLFAAVGIANFQQESILGIKPCRVSRCRAGLEIVTGLMLTAMSAFLLQNSSKGA